MMSSSLSDSSKTLIDLLSSESMNPLLIRGLCQQHPGLISSAGLRLQTWTILLLGSNARHLIGENIHNYNQNYNCNFNSSSVLTELKEENISDLPFELPIEQCLEHQVLEADIPRTRSDHEYFKRPTSKALLKAILQKFCLDYNIQYKQGMNEILAVFLSLLPSVKDAKLCFALFRSFVFRYLERFYCLDSSVYLHLSLRMFSLLLMFIDPVLGNHLNHEEFFPEFYSIQWFLTLFSRTLPLPHVLRLWDILIAVDDPSFTFYIGICLLRKNRSSFLACSKEELPELVKNLRFNTEDDIDLILKNALELYNQAPRSILRYLRLCCVSSIELSPSPYNFLIKMNANNNNIQNKEELKIIRIEEEKEEQEINKKILKDLYKKREDLENYDHMLALQCSRACLTLNPKELIESYLNSSNHYAPTTSISLEDQSNENSSNKDSQKQFKQSQQYIIIDIRTDEEREMSGGGTIPRAIHFNPSLLSDFNATLKWIQHYDTLNGINLVLLDMPLSKWTGMSLIRRLILGEGDGLLDNNTFNNGENLQYYKNYYKQNKDNYDKYFNSIPHSNSSLKYTTEKLKENLIEEFNRPSFLLASLLQTYSFSKILIVDDGYPGLILQFQNLSIKLEPMIIDFNEKIWLEYLKKSGRFYLIEKNEKKKDHPKKKNNDNNNIINDINLSSTSYTTSSSSSSSFKKLEDLTEIERIRSAIEIASKYNHSCTYKLLVQKLEDLYGKEEADIEREKERVRERERENERIIRERELVFFSDLL